MTKHDLGFFKENWFPCVIVHDRYTGSYSGALWTAFMLDQVPEGAIGDDVTCMDFWGSYSEPVGKGSTPQGAVDDLAKRVDLLLAGAP